MKVAGIVLLAAGLLGLAVGTFQYTRKKDVLNVGPIRVESRENETVAVPPLAAGAAAAIGLVLVLASRRK